MATTEYVGVRVTIPLLCGARFSKRATCSWSLPSFDPPFVARTTSVSFFFFFECAQDSFVASKPRETAFDGVDLAQIDAHKQGEIRQQGRQYGIIAKGNDTMDGSPRIDNRAFFGTVGDAQCV